MTKEASATMIAIDEDLICFVDHAPLELEPPAGVWEGPTGDEVPVVDEAVVDESAIEGDEVVGDVDEGDKTGDVGVEDAEDAVDSIVELGASTTEDELVGLGVEISDVLDGSDARVDELATGVEEIGDSEIGFCGAAVIVN